MDTIVINTKIKMVRKKVDYLTVTVPFIHG